MAIAPARMIISEQTVARIGRRMKSSLNTYEPPAFAGSAGFGEAGPPASAGFGEAGRAGAPGPLPREPGAGAGCTGAPSPIFWVPATITRSPPFRPLVTT